MKALVLLVVVTGCVNMSTLQTAKTLAPNKQQILVGGGYYASPQLDKAASSSTGTDTQLKLPYMELGYRRGVIEHLDLGAKVTVPGTAGVDAKYQLVDGGKFAVAAGLGAYYLSIESGDGMDKTSSKVVDLIVPVYVSYDIASPLAVYASPKYALRIAQSQDSMGSSSGLGQLVGATGGLRLGSRAGLYLETTYMRDLTSDFKMFQVNGALFF